MVDFGVDLPVIHEIYTKYARIINVFARNFGKKTLPYHYDSALYEIYCCLYNVGSARLLRHGSEIL